MDTPELITCLVDDLRPVSPLARPWARVLRWGLAGLAGLALGVAVYGLRDDLPDAVQQGPYLLRLVGLFALVVAASGAAMHLAVPGAAGRLRWVPLPIVGALASVGLVALMRAMLAGDLSAFTYGWDCLGKVSIAATVPAVTGAVLVDRGAPLAPRTAQGLGALAAGAVGCLAAELACPEPDPVHVFVWHLMPALAIGVIGGLLPLTRQRSSGLSRT